MNYAHLQLFHPCPSERSHHHRYTKFGCEREENDRPPVRKRRAPPQKDVLTGQRVSPVPVGGFRSRGRYATSLPISFPSHRGSAADCVEVKSHPGRRRHRKNPMAVAMIPQLCRWARPPTVSPESGAHPPISSTCPVPVWPLRLSLPPGSVTMSIPFRSSRAA